MPNKMERFTQRARRSLSLAQGEAERLQHSSIGTHHLLLGLMREGDGIAGRVLRDLGLEQQRMEELVERMTRADKRTANTQLDLSPGTKKVLELAIDEARRMQHDYIGTEHVLLGLVRQTEGIAIDVLKRLGISAEEIRRQVRRVMQEATKSTTGQQTDAAMLTEATRLQVNDLLQQRSTQPHVSDASPETQERWKTPFELSSDAIVAMMSRNALPPDKALAMLEQNSLMGLLNAQQRVIDLLEKGSITVEQSIELLKQVQTPLVPFFMGTDKPRQIHFTLTSDDNVETKFSMSFEQFQEMSQQIIASVRSGRTGNILDRKWWQDKRIQVNVDDESSNAEV